MKTERLGRQRREDQQQQTPIQCACSRILHQTMLLIGMATGTFLIGSAQAALESGTYTTILNPTVLEIGDSVPNELRSVPRSATVTLDLEATPPSMTAVLYDAVLEGSDPFELTVYSTTGELLTNEVYRFRGNYGNRTSYYFDWNFSAISNGIVVWYGETSGSRNGVWYEYISGIALQMNPPDYESEPLFVENPQFDNDLEGWEDGLNGEIINGAIRDGEVVNAILRFNHTDPYDSYRAQTLNEVVQSNSIYILEVESESSFGGTGNFALRTDTGMTLVKSDRILSGYSPSHNRPVRLVYAVPNDDPSIGHPLKIFLGKNDFLDRQFYYGVRLTRYEVQGDSEPPKISFISVTPSQLWPANHKMIPITLSVTATDNTDPHPTCSIVDVSILDESGTASVDDDVEIMDDLHLNLRAEKPRGDASRIYTITVQCTDASGNSSTKEVRVTVPHNRSRVSVRGPSKPEAPLPGYALVWSDEFNGTSLDFSKWDYRGLGARRDAVNVPEAVTVENGNLVITTYTENGTNYTGMIGTGGKYAPLYGYLEARILWADSPGLWSAFWTQSEMMTVAGDPHANGTSTSIAQHRAINSSNINLSDQNTSIIQWDGYAADYKVVSSGLYGSGLATGYHLYGLEWTPDVQNFYLDGTMMWSVTNSPEMDPSPPAVPVSHTNEYIILSSEVRDGGWAGSTPPGGYGSRETSATKMTVDYVRVYQLEESKKRDRKKYPRR